jgi:carbon storage regulator
MLALSRKQTEIIEFSNGVKVTVLKIAKGQVRLGIDAPENVRIWRGELPPQELELYVNHTKYVQALINYRQSYLKYTDNPSKANRFDMEDKLDTLYKLEQEIQINKNKLGE